MPAIKSLKPGKSPGFDGLTAHYYKTFNNLLSLLQLTLNSLMDPRQVPNSFLMAHVTVLPKPGKDPTDCSSYRPICLLNLDLKLLAKIIAKHLRTILPQLIGPEQVGFMAGREARDNVTKALNLIHRCRQDGFEGFLLSTDMEKTFDGVS